MIGEISILNVLVTGPGTIGASLALACAVHGHCVTLLGRREASLASAQKLISRCASELEESALAPAEFDGWQGRITMTTRLEAHLQKDAVLASSTSGLPVDQIAANCVRASQFAVAHFANPPHLMPVVEVVPGSDTSPETISAIEAFVRSLNKTPVRLSRDVPGHLFNRIQFAMLREAMALVEQGIATPDQVDTVVKRGLALRLAEEGPLEKIDLAGLQLVHDVATYLYPHLDNSDEPRLLKKMLDENNNGSRPEKRFYTWTAEREDRVLARRNAEIIRHLQRLKMEE